MELSRSSRDTTQEMSAVGERKEVFFGWFIEEIDRHTTKLEKFKITEKHEKRRPKWEIINTLRMNTATTIYINFNIHVQPRSLPSKHQNEKKSWWSWKLVEIGQQGANNATQFSVMPIDQIVRRSSDNLYQLPMSIFRSYKHQRADSIEFSALVFVVARARGWLVKNHAWHVEKFLKTSSEFRIHFLSWHLRRRSASLNRHKDQHEKLRTKLFLNCVIKINDHVNSV